MVRDKTVVEKERDSFKLAMSKRAAGDQRIKKLCEDMEDESKAVKAELAARKRESAKWLVELNGLNLTMDHKLTESSSSAFPYLMQNHLVAIL